LIGDYVLGYGTGAVTFRGDERDYAFANFFKGQDGMPEIKNIFADVDISKEAMVLKTMSILQFRFLNGLLKRLPRKIEELEN
jgi:leucyl-tRNA synthetase